MIRNNGRLEEVARWSKWAESLGGALGAMLRAFTPHERRHLGMMYAFIAAMHIIGWGGMLLYVVPRYPLMLGLGISAYAFGLRHAFDADHISAIDNSTRKLLQEGKKPLGVGLFFSLGHSSVVFLITLGIGLAVKFIVSGVKGGSLQSVGSLIGTGVSGTFLLIIGFFNLLVLREILHVYKQMRSGNVSRAQLEHEIVAGGLMTKVFGRVFKLIGESWHLYPVGFLFGLGFDTATEVSLLAVSATAAAQQLPVLAILVLPLIFASGMSLMDTTDGAFMAKAYSWAFSNPIRKVFYNLTVTGLSVFVALFVGGIEVLQIVSTKFNLGGRFWDAVNNIDFNKMGFVIVGAFLLTWVVAFSIWKTQRLEERWSAVLE